MRIIGPIGNGRQESARGLASQLRLLQNGRDPVGEKRSPLMVAVMDRKALKPLVADDNRAARWKGNEFPIQGSRVLSYDRVPGKETNACES